MHLRGLFLFAAVSLLTVSSCCRSKPKLHSELTGQQACPSGKVLYGESAGGFCCGGTVTNGACSDPASVCALDPGRTQGNPVCPYCPQGKVLYGESAGGFCCGGTVANGTCSDPSTICSLDPKRTQGYPACHPCPPGKVLYGKSAGGFCCGGTVANESCSNPASICALDPNRTQGNPICQVCPSGKILYGESTGGFCCGGTVANESCSDPATVCAIDPKQSQGNPVCPVCPLGQTLYGESVGGFCCSGTVTNGTCSDPASVCALDPSRNQGAPVCKTALATLPPLTVSNATSATAPFSVVMYGVDPATGQLKWYKHNGSNKGTADWGDAPSGRVVGSAGWNGFSKVFVGDSGSIYAIKPDGKLLWYGHLGQREGIDKWAQGSGAEVGSGWTMVSNGGPYQDVFAGPKGVIYALNTSGELRWYRHDGYNGSGKGFADGSGTIINSGLTNTTSMIAGASKALYRATSDGKLYYYRHNAQLTGTLSGTTTGITTWANGGNGQEITSNWGGRQLLAGPGGVLYSNSQSLRWYHHLGVSDGSARWFQGDAGSVISNDFNLINVSSVVFPGSTLRTASNPNGCLCPSNYEYWGGLCYKACPSGSKHTASCTCARDNGGIVTDCSKYGLSSGKKYRCNEGVPYGGLCYKSCPDGMSRTAACTCVSNSNWWDIKTNCSDYGLASDSTLYYSCPDGTEPYASNCYNACPSGSKRTAVCTCDSLQLDTDCSKYGEPILPQDCDASKGSVCSQLFEDVKASIPMPPVSSTLAEQTAGIAGRTMATCSLSVVEGFFCFLPDLIASVPASMQNVSISQSCDHLPPVTRELCSIFVDGIFGVENVLQCVQNANAGVQDPTFAIDVTDAVCKQMGAVAANLALMKVLKMPLNDSKKKAVVKLMELLNSAPVQGLSAAQTVYMSTFRACLDALLGRISKR